MRSELLECNSIVEECTTNFYSDGILAHSGTRDSCDWGFTLQSKTLLISSAMRSLDRVNIIINLVQCKQF